MFVNADIETDPASVNHFELPFQVHMEGYMVSNQCMALARERVLVPTKDAPELGYVKESGPKQYVPDVFYKVRSFVLQNLSHIERFEIRIGQTKPGLTLGPHHTHHSCPKIITFLCQFLL